MRWAPAAVRFGPAYNRTDLAENFHRSAFSAEVGRASGIALL